MGLDGSPGGMKYTYDANKNDQRILELCDEFVPGDPPEYFFDKNPENFSAILELHRSAIVLTKINLGDVIKF